MTDIKRNILYYGHFEIPDRNALAHRVLANARLLNSSIEGNIILFGGNKEKSIGDAYISDKFVWGGFTAYEFAYPRSVQQWIRHMLFSYDIKRIMEENRCSILIVTGIGFIKTLKLMKFSKRKGYYFVSDTVDWFPKSKSTFPMNWIKDINTFIDITFIKKRLHNMICISSFLEKKYSRHVKNIVRIPSLTDNQDLIYSSADYLPNESITSFVYAGSPGQKERMDYVVFAVLDLAAEGFCVELKIAGMTLTEFLSEYPEFIKTADEVQFFNKISFLGKISHSKCLEIIQKADFSTFAREESICNSAGFPTKFSESQACGTPVVTTPTSDISEFIIEGKNGFLAQDCSYDKYFKKMKLAASLSYDEKMLMHNYCKHYSVLDFRKFRDRVENFLLNLE